MLLQFSVENFKSFKERSVLSLEASSDDVLSDHVCGQGKDRYLKSIVLFGANNAGKSNLFQALKAAVFLVRQSDDRQVSSPLADIVPFRFDEKCQHKPSSFEFVFYTNGRKYVYGFSVTSEVVVEEYLYVYHSSRASLVFERTDTKQYRFTSSEIRKRLFPFVKNSAENKLFLASVSETDVEEIRDVYQWFDQMAHLASEEYGQGIEQMCSLYKQDKDQSLHKFMKRMFYVMDINIADYEVTNEIQTIRQIEIDDTVQEYRLPLDKESHGIQRLFVLIPMLKHVFETGGVICIDSFDAGFHPLLVEYLISLFYDSEVNKANAQLIVSTHMMELLSADVLRRDQIYFVEKDRHSGASELYSLDEFSYKEKEDYRKEYLYGRYGALPIIDDVP